MKALVKYARGEGNMEVRDIPEPTPGPGQVKIAVQNAGICGSDLHIYHGDIAIPLNCPVVTGHEFCGIIAEVGEGVSNWKPGDRVTSETAFSFCGKCVYCRSGFYNLCAERKTLGYWYNGAFTAYTVVPAERVHALPDSIDFVSGAMLEPCACVVHGVAELTHIAVGDVVLVSGPGAIGMIASQIAKAQGATVVLTGIDQDRERLDFAANLGVDYAVDSQRDSLGDVIDELTGGRGADVVLECSGVGAPVTAALDLIKKQGSFTQIGIQAKPVAIDLEKVCMKELKITGSFGSKWTSWEKAIRLVADGRINLKDLAWKALPVTQWRDAFNEFENKEGLKLILQPVG